MVKTEINKINKEKPKPMQQQTLSTKAASNEKKKKYKGVRMRSWGSWVSEIRAPNQKTRIWLGSYSTAEAAARAYDAALLCLKGSSATNLNFPLESSSHFIPQENIAMSPKSIQRVAAAAAASSSSSNNDITISTPPTSPPNPTSTITTSSSLVSSPSMSSSPSDQIDDDVSLFSSLGAYNTAKKKEKLYNNTCIRKISEHCEKHKIQFLIEVIPGKIPEHAINAAIRLNATSVILDRDMKKYKKDFMQSLSCALLLMKSDNSIKHLRGPRKEKISFRRYDDSRTVKSPESSPSLWSMKNAVFRSKSSSNLTKIVCHQLHCQIIQTPEDKDLDMARGYCILPTPDNQKTRVLEMHHKDSTFKHIRNHKTYQIVENFKNSVCSVCENKRPKFELMKEFTYGELHEATHGFSAKNYLSEGGFGSVYWGKMQGLKIAVKKHKFASLQGEKEFKSEVNALNKAIHENVVMLLGSCSEGKNRFLVYEFVCNGSLDQHLSQHSRKPLNWSARIKVAMGAAKGLLYLHENNIIHRDMRPSNILVTHDYEAMIGDFGLARTEQMDSVYSTDVVGTLGYMAPEYAESGKVSTKSDVYSFGVVLLQLITGMRTTDKRIGHKSLVGWARPLLKERNYPDLIDERMMDTYDCHQLFWMIRLAEKCLTRDPQKRLPMDTVVSALTHIVEGSTCSMVLRDCSPARSDSSYDMSESPVSDVSPEIEDEEDGIVCVGCTTVNLRPPPSPPLGSTSWSTSKHICSQG